MCAEGRGSGWRAGPPRRTIWVNLRDTHPGFSGRPWRSTNTWPDTAGPSACRSRRSRVVGQSRCTVRRPARDFGGPSRVVAPTVIRVVRTRTCQAFKSTSSQRRPHSSPRRIPVSSAIRHNPSSGSPCHRVQEGPGLGPGPHGGLLPVDPWELHPGQRVAGEQAAAGGGVHRRRQGGVHSGQGGWGHPGSEQPVVHPLHRLRCQLLEWQVAELGDQVPLDVAPVRDGGGRAQRGPAGQPAGQELRDRRAVAAGVADGCLIGGPSRGPPSLYRTRESVAGGAAQGRRHRPRRTSAADRREVHESRYVQS